MEKILDVYFHDQHVGKLIQDPHGEMVFQYSEAYLNQSSAIPLSHSLPLQKDIFTRKQCRPFFAGLLPEESKRKILAKNLGISDRNDFAMLALIGGECAGAVTLLSPDSQITSASHDYRLLSETQLTAILKELPRRPLMAGDEGVRLSLAGAQDKIAVYVEDDKISIPLGNSPSTHILKPAIAHFEGVVFNEACCMTLAAQIGLPTAPVIIGNADNIDYLLVERYDRYHENANVTRLHQEDFCQAMGIVSEMKYQAEGGPSLQQCFALIREASSTPLLDIQNFLDAVIFNFIIGNHDAHGKNFSFLYQGNSVRLTPLYDLVCTAFYPDLSQRMAMKIGNEYYSNKVGPRHFEKLADEVGLAKPLVLRRVAEVAKAIISQSDKVDISHKTAKAVLHMITERAGRIVELFG